MKVEKLMTRRVATCSAEDSLERAAQLMWAQDVGCLPVVDAEGRPVAMITDRDVCMAAYTQGVALRDARVGSAMSRSLITCTPESSIADVETMMQQAQVRRVPVVDLVGALVGIVTLGDIARFSGTSPIHAVSAPALAKTLASVSERRPALAAE